MSKRIEIDYESLQLAVKNKMLAKDMAKQFNCSKQTILKNLIEQGLYDDFLNYKRIPYSEYVKCDVCGKEIPWEKKMTCIINGERCFCVANIICNIMLIVVLKIPSQTLALIRINMKL